ncbi:MAG: M1 family metallopeptidase [Flavobacteriales bacterium]
MRMVFTALCLCAALATQAQQPLHFTATDPGAPPREHGVDFIYLLAELSFKPEAKKVMGKVTHTFKAKRLGVDSIFLDAPGIQISSMQLNGKAFPYELANQGIVLRFNPSPDTAQLNSLEITYTATPKKGLYFIGWDDPSNTNRKQIWSQGQGTDNRHWIPMFDSQNDKVVSELRVTFPEPYYVLSNGGLVSRKKTKDGQIEWQYKMPAPHANYLIMLGIGEYKVLEKKSASGVPMKLLYYPDHADRAEPTYRYSVEMFDFFEQEIGIPYPWKTYSQIPVQDFMYGAMENTSATVFGDFFCVDERGYRDRNYVAVNAHELAHQWFGDLITARSAKHHWLQESFATFYNWLYEKEAFGADHFDWNRHNAAQSALQASREDLLPVAHSQAGTVRHYPKGAHVLYMLREVCGRANYNKAIRRYLRSFGFKNVDSQDLLNSFHDELGLELDWFWNQWVYKGGEPHFHVITETVTNADGKPEARFIVRQEQEVGELSSVFQMPMNLAVYLKNGQVVRSRQWIRSKNVTLTVPLPDGAEVDFMVADENRQILSKQPFEASPEALRNMALHAKGLLDRYAALEKMREVSLNDKKTVLLQVLNSPHEFHALKLEALRQLLPSIETDPEVLSAFRSAIKSSDMELQKGSTQLLLPLLPSSSILGLLPEIQAIFNQANASYQLLENALNLACRWQPERAAEWLAATPALSGNRGKSLEICRLELTVKHQLPQADAALKSLEEYASPRYEFITQTQAWAALARLDYLSPALLDYALVAMEHSNGRLAGPVRSTLKELLSRHRHQAMLNSWLQAHPDLAAQMQSKIR